MCEQGCKCGRHRTCQPGCTCKRHVRSAETRAKIGAKSRGHVTSAETRVKISDAHRRHGYSPKGKRTRTYRTWDGMIQRCTNPRAAGYANYGGAGIGICDQWRDFATFLADMGERPEGQTLDRIDNTRGYEPSNCRWATHSEQMKNRPNFNPDKRSKR